jgi:hypothetical protein
MLFGSTTSKRIVSSERGSVPAIAVRQKGALRWIGKRDR